MRGGGGGGRREEGERGEGEGRGSVGSAGRGRKKEEGRRKRGGGCTRLFWVGDARKIDGFRGDAAPSERLGRSGNGVEGGGS